MNLSIGIVGLPNVGKSTLFNALLKKQQALAANYPFATIEPNIGIVPVPDSRLISLAEITKVEEKMLSNPSIKPATVEFIDIAGLVKGAATGAGLGNKFLSHIREVFIIAHVVRAFVDENVIREGSSDPENDYAVIQTELMIADIATISKFKDQKSKVEVKGQKEVAEKLFNALNAGVPTRDVLLTDEEKEVSKQFFLLSAKPEIIVLNVSEDEYTAANIIKIEDRFARLLTPERSSGGQVVICAKIESELSELSEDEQKQYLKDLGISQSGLERLIQQAYSALGLISFLTCGEKEVRAWTIEKGMNAQNAAGVIHTDFTKNFIKAETVSFDDFVENGGWKNSRENGKSRFEGRDYIIRDGDVVEFKIGS